MGLATGMRLELLKETWKDSDSGLHLAAGTELETEKKMVSV
jgi:hypothetical protein